jgi:GPH family glycoside/pentoside/hexuronide:cation symporter
MSILDLLGYRKGAEQSETAREAIRWMTGAAPAFFLLVGVLLLRAYPLTRRRHDEIVAELAMRDRDRDR